jgi:hypothetical protein
VLTNKIDELKFKAIPSFLGLRLCSMLRNNFRQKSEKIQLTVYNDKEWNRPANQINQLSVLSMLCHLAGNFHAFLNFFFYILVPGSYLTKKVKKCLQFVYIFADLLPVKCQTKFLILAVKCLTNCLLPQSIFLKIVCLYTIMEK